jgi:hypothetical protein
MNPRVNFLKVCPLVSILDLHDMGPYTCENEARWGHIA